MVFNLLFTNHTNDEDFVWLLLRIPWFALKNDNGISSGPFHTYKDHYMVDCHSNECITQLSLKGHVGIKISTTLLWACVVFKRTTDLMNGRCLGIEWSGYLIDFTHSPIDNETSMRTFTWILHKQNPLFCIMCLFNFNL